MTTKHPKRKVVKPVKAWAVTTNGRLLNPDSNIAHTRKWAFIKRYRWSRTSPAQTFAVVRVEIRVVKP